MMSNRLWRKAMIKRKSRTHSPEFKSKVAVIKDDLTMENDFLERGLERIHGPRGKKW